MDIVSKITGDSLSATEFNQIPSELEGLITSLGLTPSSGAVDQVAQSIARMSAGGDFYTDSGSANAYVLGTIGSQKRPTAYFDGMRVRFVPGNSGTGVATTVNVAGLGNKSVKTGSGAGSDPASGTILAGVVLDLFYDATNGVFKVSFVTAATGKRILGQGYADTSTYMTTTTSVPNDNTPWQNTEGAEALTLAYTPQDATSKLVIFAGAMVSPSSNYNFTGAALFKDSDADAIAMAVNSTTSAGFMSSVAFCHEQVAGSTASQTFKLRFGSQGGTAHLNGSSSGARFGGSAKTYIKILEIEA